MTPISIAQEGLQKVGETRRVVSDENHTAVTRQIRAAA
jgi:hypothetical protein